jgi:hypothetical protein
VAAPRKPRKADYDYHLGIKTREVVGNSVSRLISGGTLVFVFYLIYLIFNSLSGKTTFADIAVSFLADVKTSRGAVMIVSILFGGSGSAYGLYQRKLRRDDVQSRSAHIQFLESEFDKRRSSSGLTRRGTTRKEDQQ